jgi:DNA-binding response OmpR family regulator
MGLFDNVKNLVGGAKSTPPSATPTQLPSARKVLIVEDDEALRNLYKEILSAEAYTVFTAENGQIGLDTIVAQKPDLVLLDLMMPVMDGKTMLHRVRAMPEFEKLPIIVLTNAGDMNSMHETKVLGNANDFLIKANVTPEDIVNRVKSLLQL